MKAIRKHMFLILATLMVFQGSICVSAATLPEATTKTTTKTTSKTEKLSSKAKKTWTKKTTSTKKSSKIRIMSSYTRIICTVTKTVTSRKYTKGSKTVKVTVVITTTVKTTYQEPEDDGDSETDSSTAKDCYRKLTAAEKKVIGKKVSNAFTKYGWSILMEATTEGGYSGLCSVKDRTIYLSRKAGDTVIYHELGHFVSYYAGRADSTEKFAAVYKAEKEKYTKYNKAYVCQSASEFFAEAYRWYVLEPSWLKKTLPKTYAYVAAAVKKIS